MLLAPRRFTQQPQLFTDVDWGNPLSRGLLGQWTPAAPNSRGNRATIQGSVVTAAPGANGVAWCGAANTASDNYVRIERGPFTYTTEVTLEAVVRPRSFNSTTAPYIGGIISQWQYDAGAAADAPGPFIRFGDGVLADRGRVQFGVQTGVSNFRNVVAPLNSTVAGNTYHIVGVFAPGGTLLLYIDGRLVVSGNAFSTTFNNNANNFISLLSDFANNSTAQNRCLDGDLFLARIYNVAKNDSEVRALYENPWQLFKRSQSVEPLLLAPRPISVPKLLPRVSQPQPIAQVDNSNPMARGIVGWQTGVDLNKFSNGNATYPVSPPIPSLQGLARTYNIPAPATSTTAGPHLVGSLSSTVGTTTTIVSLCRPNSSEMESLRSTYGAIVHGTASIYASAGFSAYYLYFYYFGSSWTVDFSTQTALGSRTAFGNITLDSNWHVLVGRQSSATSRDVWFDGRQIASDTVSSSPASINTATIGNNTIATSAPIGQFVGDVALTIVYNRALSNSEIVQLSKNPWQIFQPQIQEYIVDLPGKYEEVYGGFFEKYTRTKQPQTPVGIDRGNPIAKGLTSAYIPFNRMAMDLANGAIDSTFSLYMPPVTSGPSGKALTSASGTDPWTIALRPANIPGGNSGYPAITVFCLFEQLDTASTGAIWGAGGTFDLTYYASFQKLNTGAIRFNPSSNSGGSVTGPVLNTNQVYALAGIQRFTQNYREFFIDGVSVGTDTTVQTNLNSGYYAGSVYQSAVDRKIKLYCGFAWTRELSPSEIKSLTDNPWQLFLPESRFTPVLSRESNIPISADTGQYLINGQAANILLARAVNAVSGAYAINGQNANLAASKILSLASGAYAITGQAAAFLTARSLDAAVGAYTIDGQPTTLLRDQIMNLSSGAYSINGQDASITAAWLFAADVGAYTINGQNAATFADRVFSMDAGAYVITGQDATITASRFLGLDSGSYVITGEPVQFLADYALMGDAGVYTINGQDASLIRATLFPAPSDVRAGVVYGPNGIYTGTLVVGTGTILYIFDD